MIFTQKSVKIVGFGMIRTNQKFHWIGFKNEAVGIGWGHFKKLSGSLNIGVSNIDVHNVYLNLLCELGIVGFVFFVLAFVITFVLSISTYNKVRTGVYRSKPSDIKYLSFSVYMQFFFLIYSAVFIDCRKGYSQSSSESLWHLSWCHWSGNNMPAVYNKWSERGGKPVFHLDDPAPFVSLLDELYTTASSEDFVRDIHINEHLTKLVSLLMEQTVYDENKVYQDGAVASDKITTGADRIDVGEVKSYIDSHYRETLSLEGLADQVFVNKNYLARLFKEMFGMSVGGYIQLVRIGKAKELLRFSGKTVEQISRECGYGGDSNYFSRVFKKVEDCSPSEFRRNWMSNGVSDE